MNDVDALNERLQELGRHAPMPSVEVSDDVHRGRVALRRRHARRRAGAGTTLLALGAVATVLPNLPRTDHATDPAIHPAAKPSGQPYNFCAVTAPPATATASAVPHEGIGTSVIPPGQMHSDFDGLDTSALAGYREAAAAILDPSRQHLDLADAANNIQGGIACKSGSGRYLTELGTRIGWKSGPALGVVRIDVGSPELDQPLQVVGMNTGWSPYRGALPAGVMSARVTESSDGRAVVVKRNDGLTVAIEAEGVYGNNVAPGSPAATNLPGIDQLLALAASPELTLPKG